MVFFSDCLNYDLTHHTHTAVIGHTPDFSYSGIQSLAECLSFCVEITFSCTVLYKSSGRKDCEVFMSCAPDCGTAENSKYEIVTKNCIATSTSTEGKHVCCTTKQNRVSLYKSQMSQ